MTQLRSLYEVAQSGALYAKQITTPIATLTLLAEADALCAVLWERETRNLLPSAGVTKADTHPLLCEAERQIKEYFCNRRIHFTLPLRFYGTAFQQQAWHALQQIPYGKTISYQQQAEVIGNPRAVRAVGAANGQNPLSIIVPCHRVIGKNGSLTGFAAGVDIKQRLIEHEASLVHTLAA